jgi:hypothetical protein
LGAATTIAAHTRGLLVVAHVSSTAGVEEVVSAGVDVLAHVPANAELDKALVERMAEAGIVAGPTLATIENTLGEPGGAETCDDWPMPGSLCWRARMLRTREPCSERACTGSSNSLSGAASARRRPWPLPRLNRHECSASPTEDVSLPGSARTWSSCLVTR